MSETKRCTKCGVEKLVTDFYIIKATNKLHSWCKECLRVDHKKWWQEHREQVRIANKKWRQTHPEQVRANGKKRAERWRQAHPEQVRTASRKWRQAHLEERRAYSIKYNKEHPEIIRRINLKKSYGEENLPIIRVLFETQGDICAICGKKPEKEKRLCVDHNHTTGEIRALLCKECNRALGKVEKNPQLYIAMLEYLEQWMPGKKRRESSGT